MTWNPSSPDIKALQDFAEEFDRSVVVAFSLEPDGDTFHITTYGKTKSLCKLAASLGDEISKGIADGAIRAPIIEPDHIDTTQVWKRVKYAKLAHNHPEEEK